MAALFACATLGAATSASARNPAAASRSVSCAAAATAATEDTPRSPVPHVRAQHGPALAGRASAARSFSVGRVLWSAAPRLTASRRSLGAERAQTPAPAPTTAEASSSQQQGSGQNLSEALKDVVVFRASDGAAVPAFELWSKNSKRTCIAFFRHWGCVLCKQQAESLSRIADRLSDCGVELVGVGSGTVEQAQGWAAEVPFAGAVYTDPDKKAYAALGLARGLLTTFNPQSLVETVGAFQAGYTQNWDISLEVDGFQQGGLFVVEPDGTVLFAHRERRAGDHAPLDAVLAACRR